MPMRYRSSSPPLHPSYPDQIEPTDADDSIVLSDLVRTGEASRLRRRGAMRLDHNLLSAQRNEGGRATPPTVVVARTPSWIEPPSDDDESTQTWEQGYDPSSSPRPQDRSIVSVPDTYGYTLYCGGEETSSSSVQQTSVYVRSPLPSYPPVPSDGGLARRDIPTRKTNGCGAVIHLRASRREGSSVWVGKDEATSAVVPMDASYFERRTVVRMIRSACGCVREGVGCAICGNTLGTRYKPCQTAADGLFSLQHVSQAPICPQGPRYWHGRAPAANSTTSPSYIYTFFASNVTRASQSPTPRVPPPSSTSPEESFYSVENAFDTLIDRLASASPLPMTDEDRITLEQSSRPQADLEFDPDGAPLPSDPGSPDKTSAELVLLPGR
ncbi:hypothetical protein JVT61DRAFT_6085 [Boletus reticuloceps]|uniref:Uncharacterized protein n=1 Tax=Boletus reticuloceps TaxID=495285 RepID=A0A8I3A6V3_9AGAM|nr:hypothetical protein JVT61DRAFT_14203 [Boletus reticuloceps]KAG6373928.1 hypothetical protein JVT61DRAFT_6085 [Boletus reticuloceps]